MSPKILLADDHQMFREALRTLLEREANLVIVAETGNGNEVLALCHQTQPDIVCLDIAMPGLDGIEVTRQLKIALPLIKVIALSTFSDRKYVRDMLNAGASAYVTKVEAGDELLRAIDAVSRNRSYLCPDATDAVKDALTDQDHDSTLSENRLGVRELQVLKLVAEGLTSIQIAEQLNIMPSTVEVHRRNIMRKINVNGVAGITRYAIRHGLVS
ncbi:MAG: response regulator transcription factor [Betaproteobacteria bacterium]